MRWRQLLDSKYFFTVSCLGYIFLLTSILVLVPDRIEEHSMHILWKEGKIAEEQGDYDNAVQKLEEAMNCMVKKEIELVDELAQVKVKMNQFDEAIKLYTRIIKTDDAKSDIYVKRGFLYIHTGNYSQALEDYQNAIKKEPYKKEIYETIVQQLESYGYLEAAAVFRDTANRFFKKISTDQ